MEPRPARRPAAQSRHNSTPSGIPLGRWIRGPLSEWAAELLSEQALKVSGLFDVAYVRQRFHEHQAGRLCALDGADVPGLASALGVIGKD